MFYIAVACSDTWKHYGVIKCDILQYLLLFFLKYAKNVKEYRHKSNLKSLLLYYLSMPTFFLILIHCE